MQKLVRNLPWLVAGAALYHFGRVLLTQREANLLLLAARRKAEAQAKNRRLYLLATTCQRGTLN
jgi:hypothetical protein